MQETHRQFHNISFLPISVEKQMRVFDLSIIEDALEKNQHHSKYKSYWDTLGVIGRIPDGDFTNEEKSLHSWLLRYQSDSAGVIMNPHLPPEFAGIVEYAYSSFPLEYITHLTVVRASREIPPHFDIPRSQKFQVHNDNVGPTLLKILLNPQDYDQSIYSLPDSWNTKESERRYFTMPADTNLFAMSENRYPHGAIFNRNTKRLLVNIFGKINLPRWQERLKNSCDKYADYLVSHSHVPEIADLNSKLFADV